MTDFPLPTPFREQMAVETRFKIPANAQIQGAGVFNLMKNDLNNIMIHVRVDRDELGLNTCISGTWGDQINVPCKGIGTPGNTVTIRVQARSDHFLITVNGKDLYQYKYRSSFTDINMGHTGSGLEYYTVFYSM